jgi:hypothetical protein
VVASKCSVERKLHKEMNSSYEFLVIYVWWYEFQAVSNDDIIQLSKGEHVNNLRLL